MRREGNSQAINQASKPRKKQANWQASPQASKQTIKQAGIKYLCWPEGI